MEGSVELALQLEARITGFVVEPDLPLSVAEEAAESFAERVQAHQARNEAHARALLDQFGARASAAGVAFSGVSITAYSVDDAITQEAEKHGCDMIVIVTHGRGAVGEFMFGSHAKKIISRTSLPVLVLH